MREADQERTRAPDLTCGARALCGWPPPSLPADSTMKRRVDRVRLGNLAAASVVVVVVGLLNVAAHLPVQPRPGRRRAGWPHGRRMVLAQLLAVSARPLPITGPGWIAFGAFALVEAIIGHSLIAGYEQAVFFGILAIAVLFEISWYLGHHTNAIATHPH